MTSRIIIVFLTAFFHMLLAKGQGLNINDDAYQRVPLKKSSFTISKTLPNKIDLSPFVPSVIDQGVLGTCVGVSTTYYMRTIMEARRLNITDKKAIDALRYSPSYLYNAVKNEIDTNCNGGTEIEVALEYLKTKGVAKFSEQGYPYCDTNKPIAIHKSSQILDYVKLFGLNYLENSKEAAIKKALAEGSPVVVGIHTTNSLERLGNNLFWKKLWWQICGFFGIEIEIGLWKPERSRSLRSGHAVCIVGYDDTKYGGAFHAVNSRGENWGDDGFFWIRYSDVPEYVKYGFQAYISAGDDMQKEERSADIVIKYPYKILDAAARFERVDLELGRRSKEKIAAFALSEIQRTRTAYQVNINIDKQTYLYVLDVSASKLNGMTILFPRSDSVHVTVGDTLALSKMDSLKIPTQTDSMVVAFKQDSLSAFIGGNTKLMLPSEKEIYALQPPDGTQYWLFLFTETQLDINDCVYVMNHTSGSLSKRIYAAFGNAIVPFNQIKYPLNKMGFILEKGHQGHIVPLVIRVRHQKRPPRIFAQGRR